MPKIAKALPRGTRYGPFLSIGNLVGLRSKGTKDMLKVQFLPQWVEDGRGVEAVLSKRFLMADLGLTEITHADLDGMERIARGLARAVKGSPEQVLAIANAFGPSGSREDRVGALHQARALGLVQRGDNPIAIWGVVIGVAAALILAGCCQETDSDCGGNGTDGDDDKGGGSSGGDTDTDSG